MMAVKIQIPFCALLMLPMKIVCPLQMLVHHKHLAIGVGREIQLNGSGSYDLDGDTLTYSWSIIDVPEGSNVDSSSLSNVNAVSPFFTYDVPGKDYVFQLQVADQFSSSTLIW